VHWATAKKWLDKYGPQHQVDKHAEVKSGKVVNSRISPTEEVVIMFLRLVLLMSFDEIHDFLVRYVKAVSRSALQRCLDRLGIMDMSKLIVKLAGPDAKEINNNIHGLKSMNIKRVQPFWFYSVSPNGTILNLIARHLVTKQAFIQVCEFYEYDMNKAYSTAQQDKQKKIINNFYERIKRNELYNLWKSVDFRYETEMIGDVFAMMKIALELNNMGNNDYLKKLKLKLNKQGNDYNSLDWNMLLHYFDNNMNLLPLK
jgi:hypothetical protein